MEMRDPFNYPALNRKDLMGLSTLNQANDGQKTTTKDFVTKRNVSSNLYTLDIEGAQPKAFGSRTFNKPDLKNYNADIDGSMSRQLHFQLERQEYNLETRDIEGTRPNVTKDTIRTNRRTNPLHPEYKLPEVVRSPPTPPKFLRDAINIDDIDGARPKKKKDFATRNNMNVKDIEGAQPKKFKPRETNYDALNYSDLTKEEFHSKRVVNPLNPVYHLRDYAGNPIVHGTIEGSEPRRLPSRSKGPVSSDLNTQDIEGSQANTKGKGGFGRMANKEARDNIGVKDITGAQVGTVHNGPLSKRVTNPIVPEYQALGRMQTNLREDCVYAEPSKEQPIKKTNTRSKPEWKKSEIIPVIEDKKIERVPRSTGSPVVDEALKSNMAVFYGVRPNEIKAQNIAMVKEEAKGATSVESNPALNSDPALAANAQKFFGNEEDSKVQWEKNVDNFYKPSEVPSDVKPQFNLSTKDKGAQPKEALNGSVYKKNEAAFFGEQANSRPSSKGSIFQRDAAHFYGYETPKPGEKPFEVPAPEVKSNASKPVLAQRDMRNMPKDPKYQSNMVKFFGAEQDAKKKQSTYAEKLQKFIGH